MHRTANLPTIRNVIRENQLRAKKALGQNYLIDLNMAQRIVKSAGKISNCDILEIGPGAGSLTRLILESGPRKLVLIEKDKQFVNTLNQLKTIFPNKIELIFGDALNIEFSKILKPPVKIISNLPYNVGTKILINFLTASNWPPYWKTLTFMFQSEVAERLIASPNTKAYGRLTILAQWRAKVKLLFHVPRDVFFPKPKVDSSIIQIEALDNVNSSFDINGLQMVTKKAFMHRRKMLKHSLKSEFPNIEEILYEINVSPTARPENLSVEKFCNLAEKLF